MSTHVWAVEEVTIVIAGINIEHGTPEGGILTAAPEPQFSALRDVRGNVARSRTNNPIVPFELKLFNWSRHNQELSLLLAGDTLSNAGAGIGVLAVNDNQGATIFAATNCWVTQAPTDWGLSEEAFEVTWNLTAVIPPEFLIFGGN